MIQKEASSEEEGYDNIAFRDAVENGKLEVLQ